MYRFLSIASGVALCGIGSALAAEPSCAGQLARIKPQVTSELLAQSADADKYEEVERVCATGSGKKLLHRRHAEPTRSDPSFDQDYPPILITRNACHRRRNDQGCPVSDDESR